MRKKAWDKDKLRTGGDALDGGGQVSQPGTGQGKTGHCKTSDLNQIRTNNVKFPLASL
jgi:hypothetical protein